MSKHNGNGYTKVSELDTTGLPKGRKFYLSLEISGNNEKFDVQVVEKGKLKISLNKSMWILKTEKLFVGQTLNIPENIFIFSGLAEISSILIRQKVNHSDKSNGSSVSSKDNESQEILEKVEDLSKLASHSYSNKPFAIHISHSNPFKGGK